MNIDIKRLCFERDAFVCRHCGSGKDLDIFETSKYSSINNMFTLCSACKNKSINARDNGSENRVGVVLCGGRGTRLYPITRVLQKHEMPIGVLPAVFYPLKTLRFFGIKKVLFVLDRDNPGSMIQLLGSGAEFGMDFSYKVQEGASGIASALYLARDFAKPGDEIMCILGDNIFDRSSLNGDVSLDEAKACVWLKEVDDPRAYGVAEIKNGMVVDIEEKPDSPKSNKAVVGLYMYDYSVFDVIESIKPSDRGETEISDVNAHFAYNGNLKYYDISGYWSDMGSSSRRYAECSIHGAKENKITAEEIDEFKYLVFDDK